MSGDYRVDPGALGTAAGALHGGGAALEALGGSVPPAPEAGPASGAMAAVLATLVRSAGNLSTGVNAAAAAVQANAAAYTQCEVDEASRFSGLH